MLLSFTASQGGKIQVTRFAGDRWLRLTLWRTHPFPVNAKIVQKQWVIKFSEIFQQVNKTVDLSLVCILK
jgi:hypothetical protein